ncbi:hypothetical protein KPL78_02420 [Roseomonas sp. HJA6]|uniref:Uncharacterized protein n=1 Tax=Roseomonas alba TaxID=2846776 RepID=A0ABS7A5W3_9PROT|nr:hypothetical protein [Neoroseomonas alba]MBW6396680.1 hypothetical protein [Neoroseomonas alba]
MPPTGPTPRAAACLVALLALLMPAVAAGQSAADQIDITAVVVEGKTAQACAGHIEQVVAQAQKLSLVTTPPHDLLDGLRAFYDLVLRLDAHGELSSTTQLGTVYVTGYGADGERRRRAVTPFIRTEVSRPAGMPADAPSLLSMSWLWLQRVEPATDTAGRAIERPQLHRFDFVGEVAASYGSWSHAVARCRPGGDRQWFGAVAIWTYLPP